MTTDEALARIRRRGPIMQGMMAEANQLGEQTLEEWLGMIAAQAVENYAALFNDGLDDAVLLARVRKVGGLVIACLEGYGVFTP